MATERSLSGLKKMIIFLLLVIPICTIQAQTDGHLTIPQAAESIAIDPQGNLYLVNDASLYKYSLDGNLLNSYTNNMLGSIASIDVDNPLKIMVFYRDAGTILFLDGKLAPIGDVIDIFSKGLTTISIATYSTKNNLILFDEANKDLIILDFYFQVKERIHYDFEKFNPFILKDLHEKQLFLQDAEHGVFVFDNFGTYEKTIALPSQYPMQWISNQLFYLNDNQLNSYNHFTLEAKKITSVPETVRQALIYQDKLILLDAKKVTIIQDFSVTLQK